MDEDAVEEAIKLEDDEVKKGPVEQAKKRL